MRPEEVAAERAKEVRDAARRWRLTGFITETSLALILAAYPDDRRRFGPGFRALAFILTGVATLAIVGVSFFLVEPSGKGNAALLLFWAMAFMVLTEIQRGPWQRADGGAESATALISVLLAIFGTVGLLEPSSHSFVVPSLISACCFCALATWRWGDTLFPLGAGLAAFALLAQMDQGRLPWIVSSLLLVPACLRAGRDGRFAPSHRKAAVILGAISILALYGAVHIWSLEQGTIESMNTPSSQVEVGPLLRLGSILATALLPPVLLLIGWRRREPLLLYAGLLLVGASLATVRLYRQVMPLSFALILIGAVCLAIALGIRQWLRAGARGERDGFTADPLFDRANGTEDIRAAVAMASFTPPAQSAATRPAFEGGGGGFGGGGASGSF